MSKDSKKTVVYDTRRPKDYCTKQQVSAGRRSSGARLSSLAGPRGSDIKELNEDISQQLGSHQPTSPNAIGSGSASRSHTPSKLHREKSAVHNKIELIALINKSD